MAHRLADYQLGEPIFVDANIFAYHHSSHPRFGSQSSDFLARVESGSLHAVTSNVVQQEVMYFLQMHKGMSLLGTSDRSRVHDRIAVDASFAAECWRAAEAYLNLLDALRANKTLTVFEVDSSYARLTAEVGRRYRLILRDATHVCVCHAIGLHHVASNDGDLDRIDFLTRWQP